MIFKKILYSIVLPLLTFSSFAEAKTPPVVKINFVFATSNTEGLRNDNLKQIHKELSILNHYFVDQGNEQIFQFKLNQYINYSQFKKMNCNLRQILEQPKSIQHLEVKKYFNQCFTREPNTVYLFIYDAYNLKRGHNDITSWGFNNNNRPFVLIDWERLNYKTQAALPHEMGHAFGLRHVCAPNAKLKDATNIMASVGNLCSGSGGQRNQGFDQNQLEIIIQKYLKLH